MQKEQLIREALALPQNVIAYHVSQVLAERFPDKTFVEGEDGHFDVEEYAKEGHCSIEHSDVVYNQVISYWIERQIGPVNWTQNMLRIGGIVNSVSTQQGDTEQDQVVDGSKNAWMTVTWHGFTFDVIVMRWTDNMHQTYHFWIIADVQETAREFMLEVCRWNVDVRGEVLVFTSGCWQKDARLFQAIKGATFDNLILKGDLKQEIHQDLVQFFAARSTYEMYGIPWKRGILLVGPPGNGKTHTVKAIINALDQPCLYVKSFNAEYRTDEDNIRQVFERARRSAPCILVFEDLDALLTSQNRSFFLNELDGFAANTGIVALATTNHPERLDPAILDRPSRFDRKYSFDLPELAEREAYIEMWNASLQPAIRLSNASTHRLSELSEGFSFAYLKELFLSSMMRWVSRTQEGTMEETMIGQVNTLRDQMVSATALEAVEPSGEQEMPMFGPMMGRSIRVGRRM